MSNLDFKNVDNPADSEPPQLDENANILNFMEIYQEKGHDTMFEMLLGEAFIMRMEEIQSGNTLVITAAEKNFRGSFRELIDYLKQRFML